MCNLSWYLSCSPLFPKLVKSNIFYIVTIVKNLLVFLDSFLSLIGGVVYLQSCVWLFCDPMDCSPSGSMRYPRQENWSTFPFLSPGDLPDPGIKATFPALAGRFFTTELPGKPLSLINHIKINNSSLFLPSKGFLYSYLWALLKFQS